MPKACLTAERQISQRPTPWLAVRTAVRCAWLAPLHDETRPFVFRRCDDAIIELCGTRGGTVPVRDVHDRESLISAGAAFLYVRVSLRAAGYGSLVERLPSTGDTDCLARAHLDATHVPTPADQALAAAIARRQPTGHAVSERAIAPHVLSLLLGAARAEGAWLGFVDSPELRRALASLVAEARPRQSGNPEFGADSWSPANSDAIAAAEAARSARLRAGVERAPTVAVLMTAGDSPADWLTAGQALARVVLTARAAGIVVSHLNPLVDFPGLRPGLAELVREAGDPGVPGRRGGMPLGATPQVLLRLGHAPNCLLHNLST